MLTEDQVKARIGELTKERDAFVQEANGRVGFLNGQIAALQALIAPPPPDVAK